MKIVRFLIPIIVLIFLTVLNRLVYDTGSAYFSGIITIFCLLWFVIRIIISFFKYSSLNLEEVKIKYIVCRMTLKKILVTESVFVVYMMIYHLYLSSLNTSYVLPSLFFLVAAYGSVILVVYGIYLYEKSLALKRYLGTSPISTLVQTPSIEVSNIVKKESSHSIWGLWIAISTLVFTISTISFVYYIVKILCDGGFCDSDKTQMDLITVLYLGGFVVPIISIVYIVFALGYLLFLFLCIRKYKGDK